MGRLRILQAVRHGEPDGSHLRQQFTKEMKQQNGVSYRQRRVDSRRTYCYVGVDLTDDAPQPQRDGGDDQNNESDDDGDAPTSLNDY